MSTSPVTLAKREAKLDASLIPVSPAAAPAKRTRYEEGDNIEVSLVSRNMVQSAEWDKAGYEEDAESRTDREGSVNPLFERPVVQCDLPINVEKVIPSTSSSAPSAGGDSRWNPRIVGGDSSENVVKQSVYNSTSVAEDDSRWNPRVVGGDPSEVSINVAMRQKLQAWFDITRSHKEKDLLKGRLQEAARLLSTQQSELVGISKENAELHRMLEEVDHGWSQNLTSIMRNHASEINQLHEVAKQKENDVQNIGRWSEHSETLLRQEARTHQAEVQMKSEEWMAKMRADLQLEHQSMMRKQMVLEFQAEQDRRAVCELQAELRQARSSAASAPPMDSRNLYDSEVIQTLLEQHNREIMAMKQEGQNWYRNAEAEERQALHALEEERVRSSQKVAELSSLMEK